MVDDSDMHHQTVYSQPFILASCAAEYKWGDTTGDFRHIWSPARLAGNIAGAFRRLLFRSWKVIIKLHTVYEQHCSLFVDFLGKAFTALLKLFDIYSEFIVF